MMLVDVYVDGTGITERVSGCSGWWRSCDVVTGSVGRHGWLFTDERWKCCRRMPSNGMYTLTFLSCRLYRPTSRGRRAAAGSTGLRAPCVGQSIFSGSR